MQMGWIRILCCRPLSYRQCIEIALLIRCALNTGKVPVGPVRNCAVVRISDLANDDLKRVVELILSHQQHQKIWAVS